MAAMKRRIARSNMTLPSPVCSSAAIVAVTWWVNSRKGDTCTTTALGYRGKCPERYTREEKLVERFAYQLRTLIIPPSVLEWLREEIVINDATERAARAQILRRYQMELDRLQTRLDVL